MSTELQCVLTFGAIAIVFSGWIAFAVLYMSRTGWMLVSRCRGCGKFIDLDQAFDPRELDNLKHTCSECGNTQPVEMGIQHTDGERIQIPWPKETSAFVQRNIQKKETKASNAFVCSHCGALNHPDKEE